MFLKERQLRPMLDDPDNEAGKGEHEQNHAPNDPKNRRSYASVTIRGLSGNWK